MTDCTTAEVVTLGYQQDTIEQTISYTYDPLGRLTGTSYDNGREYNYTYDAVGNRLTESTADGVDTYTYNINNQLSTVNDTEYSYDQYGNLRYDGIKSYTYDSSDRLTQVYDQSDITQYTYTYDGMGNLLKEYSMNYPTQVSETVTYSLDIAGGLSQVLSDGSNTYTYGYNRIAQVNDDITGYFLDDALGSVRQVVDANDEIVLSREYSPYGETLASLGSFETEFGYTGELTDGTGLINLRARYYDPGTGRFITKDSWAGDFRDPSTLNKWNYVEGNPINYVDPMGLWSLAPGFDLENGGIYGDGLLYIEGCPRNSSSNCFFGINKGISIFVPPIINGTMYNDKAYLINNPLTGSPSLNSILTYAFTVKEVSPCEKDKLLINFNSNNWVDVKQYTGKSYAFSEGAFTNLTVGMGLGMGYESGYAPADIDMDITSYDNNWSIALQFFQAQSKAERERLNLVEVFNKSSADVFDAKIGGVAFLVQGATGVATYNSRTYTITIQKNQHAGQVYRAIIETYSAYTEIRNNRLIFTSRFLSYRNDSWRESLYYIGYSD